MDPFRLRSLIAPAMASLFLMLSLCAFVVQRPPSVGMHLLLPRVRTNPIDDCSGVDRWIVVLLHKNGSYSINEEQVPVGELGSRLGEIYENREHKMILMFSDPEVSYGEFAKFYSTVASSTSNLRIDLRTRQLQAELQKCPPGGSCGLEWPDHTYVPCVARQPLLLPTPRHARR
jgi:biopolymer transport protein ExbD